MRVGLGSASRAVRDRDRLGVAAGGDRVGVSDPVAPGPEGRLPTL